MLGAAACAQTQLTPVILPATRATQEEGQTRRGSGACLRSHSRQVAELGREPSWCGNTHTLTALCPVEAAPFPSLGGDDGQGQINRGKKEERCSRRGNCMNGGPEAGENRQRGKSFRGASQEQGTEGLLWSRVQGIGEVRWSLPCGRGVTQGWGAGGKGSEEASVVSRRKLWHVWASPSGLSW